MVTRTLFAALLLAIAACAQGSPALDQDQDQRQGLPPEDEDRDQPPGPPGSSQCDEGYHACGQTCLADAATNDRPELGCVLGCGQPCPTPANGVATCTDDGVCGFECASGFARVGANCVASVCNSVGYSCGSYTDDVGTTFNCGACTGGATCGANHRCVIGPDAQEPNNTSAQARSLGTFDDWDNASRWVENLNINTATDEDWFKLKVVDGWDGTNPRINVQLTERTDALGWLASPHELTVWWKCDSGDAGSRVSCGEWYSTGSENTINDALGKGCKVDARYAPWADISASCSGLNDHGTVHVRVRRTSPPLGDSYDLFVKVE